MQSIQEELAVLFPDIQFWRTFRPVELTGDALELIIPTHHVREQGYSISTDQDCQVILALYYRYKTSTNAVYTATAGFVL